MSCLRVLRYPPKALLCRSRAFASKSTPPIPKAPLKGSVEDTEPTLKSACLANTILPGVNYLKAQPPVLALPDDEYPDWLWTLLEPKVWPDDGPGGKAEQVRRRKENRQRIKDMNFMKTQ